MSANKTVNEKTSHLEYYPSAIESKLPREGPRTKRPSVRHDPTRIAEALRAVHSGQLTLTQAGKQFDIPRSTLYDKRHGKSGIMPQALSWLPPEEEEQIKHWIVASGRLGCGQTEEKIKLAVQRTLQQIEKRKTGKKSFRCDKPGRKWFTNFKARSGLICVHAERIIVSETSVKTWFKGAEQSLIDGGIDIRNVDPGNIFNCDEAGFVLHGISDEVVLNEKSVKYPSHNPGAKPKNQITVLGCASATGQVLAPMIVYPGPKSLQFDPQLQFPSAHYAITPKGWMTREVFISWLESAFVPATEDLPRPVILFADGHSFDYDESIHEICMKNEICMYTLPPHMSFIVQPLDLIFYERLKHEWMVTKAKAQNMGANLSVPMDVFAKVYYDAWQRSFCSDLIQESFRASGIHPWDPDAPDYSKCKADFYRDVQAPPRCRMTYHGTSTDQPFFALPEAEPSTQIIIEAEDDTTGTVRWHPRVLEALGLDEDTQLIIEEPNGSFDDGSGILIKPEPGTSTTPSHTEPGTSSHAYPGSPPTASSETMTEEPELILKTETRKEGRIVTPDIVDSGCVTCPNCNTTIDARPTDPQFLMVVDDLINKVIVNRWSKEDYWIASRKVCRDEEPGPSESAAYKTFRDLYKKLNPPPMPVCQNPPRKAQKRKALKCKKAPMKKARSSPPQSKCNSPKSRQTTAACIEATDPSLESCSQIRQQPKPKMNTSTVDGDSSQEKVFEIHFS